MVVRHGKLDAQTAYTAFHLSAAIMHLLLIASMACSMHESMLEWTVAPHRCPGGRRREPSDCMPRTMTPDALRTPHPLST
jgi:hypothetical protein